jgi:hypothetical protein
MGKNKGGEGGLFDLRDFNEISSTPAPATLPPHLPPHLSLPMVRLFTITLHPLDNTNKKLKPEFWSSNLTIKSPEANFVRALLRFIIVNLKLNHKLASSTKDTLENVTSFAQGVDIHSCSTIVADWLVTRDWIQDNRPAVHSKLEETKAFLCSKMLKTCNPKTAPKTAPTTPVQSENSAEREFDASYFSAANLAMDDHINDGATSGETTSPLQMERNFSSDSNLWYGTLGALTLDDSATYTNMNNKKMEGVGGGKHCP